MALQIETTHHGLLVPAGYARINRFTFFGKTSCRAFMALYASADAKDGEPLTGWVVDFVYDFDSTVSLHGQAYNAAKLLPELAGAVDV